jgi:hypothetical protein
MDAISDAVKARRDEYDVPWAPIPLVVALAGDRLLLLTAGGAPWGGGRLVGVCLPDLCPAGAALGQRAR